MSLSPTRQRSGKGKPEFDFNESRDFDSKPEPLEIHHAVTKTRDRALRHVSTFGRLARGTLHRLRINVRADNARLRSAHLPLQPLHLLAPGSAQCICRQASGVASQLLSVVQMR